MTLFRRKAAVTVSKEKKQASALKKRVQLYSSLYIGCKLRQANLEDFFRHENHDYPPALSDHGKIRKPCLSEEKTECSKNTVYVSYERPDSHAALIDGAVMVQMNAPKSAKTYRDYI